MNRKNKKVSHSWGGDRSGLGKQVGRPLLPEDSIRVQIGIYMNKSTRIKLIKAFGSLKEFGACLDEASIQELKNSF